MADPGADYYDFDFPNPSGVLLCALTAYYKSASLNPNGTATLTFTIPREMKDRLIPLSDNSGMQLNVAFWEQDVDVDAEIGRALGFEVDGDEED